MDSTRSAVKPEYRFDNSWAQARGRLAASEMRNDPGTVRHLQALGVSEGWRCLEVGGGGGSITEWLCRRVGSAGHVVATDINPRFLQALDFPNLEVRRHNLVEDELEVAAFDLVHTRAVLVHVGERDKALDRLVAALKPGGWLVAEEPDCISFVADPCSRGTGMRTISQGRAGSGGRRWCSRPVLWETRLRGFVRTGPGGCRRRGSLAHSTRWITGRRILASDVYADAGGSSRIRAGR